MEKGTTVKELAFICGVSRQAIHKRIKQLSTELTGELSTVDGKIYISEKGKRLIKSTFSDKPCQPVDSSHPSTVDNTVDTLIQMLREEIAIKNKELEAKNKQIDELTARLAELTAALVSAQNAVEGAQALHAGTVQKMLEAPKSERKGFFSRFKKDK